MEERTKTFLGLHLAVFLAGGTGLFGRYVSISGLPLVWIRIFFSLISMAAVMAFLKKFRRLPASTVTPIAACGVLLACHWVAFYMSIQAANVSVGVACIATTGFFTTIFESVINRRRLSVTSLLISFISIAGALVIFSLDVRYRLGIALGLLCSAIYSLFSIYNIRVGEKTGEDSVTMLSLELVGGFIFLSACMPVFIACGKAGAVMPSGREFAAIALLGSVFTVIPFLLQLMALRRLSAFTVNITYNLEPVYSIILAAILFGETRELNASFWVGLSLIVISVVLQTLRFRRSGSIS